MWVPSGGGVTERGAWTRTPRLLVAGGGDLLFERLDVANGGDTNGTPVVMYDCYGTSNQMWIWRDLSVTAACRDSHGSTAS